ncbi:tripartite tricarboxylate transporter substrate-binding protein [Variovorax saccharolyticus]|uniref:tripartite tricarboxylate transporter substrate-binding protein n=1 Tax=Variovorax saccharolyticus TaxID=3053516 RepID=UPI002575DAD8|nr:MULTISPECIES: tripartite tricarboxylate transporter substrate-binding protein [unclassified Variovorax]MDM0021681.1 tripartite tricarboxylate transporter substrate-binding protein [Variovorax sp. J22R187]MDM0028064.1 tripartite tricarboxylate transporter substrate-binding protein [Variovorax sp. J31P216]
MTVFSTMRRRMFGLVAFALAAAASPASAAGDFPSGPIRILVGFPAGGTIDVVARQVAEQMREELGVPVTVENPTGAGGQLAAQALKRAAPDGRTLMLAPDHTAVIIPLTLAQPGFDVASDFAPIGLVANYAGALAVSQASGIKDMSGLLAAAKADAKAGNVGVSAAGSKPQFQLDALARKQGVPLASVPFRGSVPMVQDLAGGHLTAGITALGDFLEFHRAGKLKVIAMVGDRRSAVLPEVPTASELGYPMRIDFWVGMFAPAGTPKPTVERLNAVLNKALAAPKVQQRMAGLVFEPRASTPAELSERIAAETKHWGPIIAASDWVRQ